MGRMSSRRARIRRRGPCRNAGRTSNMAAWTRVRSSFCQSLREQMTTDSSLRVARETTRSARFGAGERNACPERLVPVPLGEALGLPVGEKARVRPAVVAHGQGAMAQVDNLHHVRMTALLAESVIVVAPVRRIGSARCHPGHLRQIPSLIHDLLPSSFVRRGLETLAAHR